MSRFLSLILAVLVTAVLAPLTTSTVATAASGVPDTLQARFGAARGLGGGSLSARRGTYGRARYPARSGYGYRRRGSGFGSTLLKGLGIAYLAHMLFGWGSGGGSPIPLLLILAFLAWMVTRRRRRPSW